MRKITSLLFVFVLLASASLASAKPPVKVLMHHYLGNGTCQEKEVLPEQVADNPEWELGPCPPTDDDDTDTEDPGEPVIIIVTSDAQAAGPILPQVEFWSHPTSPAGVAILDENGTWHVIYDLEGIVVFSIENGKIEFRNDRFNPALNGPEDNVTLSRLVLGNSGADTDPRHYRTFDLAHYFATGELLFTNVFTSFNDEWCNQFSICGVSYNWTNGEFQG
jgi:hypothetical protein